MCFSVSEFDLFDMKTVNRSGNRWGKEWLNEYKMIEIDKYTFAMKISLNILLISQYLVNILL